MSFEIKWDQRALDRVLEEAKANAIRDVGVPELKRRLEAVSCPEHGRHATIVAVSNGVEARDICCDKLEQAIEQALAA